MFARKVVLTIVSGDFLTHKYVISSGPIEYVNILLFNSMPRRKLVLGYSSTIYQDRYLFP